MTTKLFAFMVSDLGWKALLAFMIYQWDSAFVGQDLMMTVVVVSGIVQMAFLLGGQRGTGSEPVSCDSAAKQKPTKSKSTKAKVPPEVSK